MRLGNSEHDVTPNREKKTAPRLERERR
jgi:hypothetical protein